MKQNIAQRVKQVITFLLNHLEVQYLRQTNHSLFAYLPFLIFFLFQCLRKLLILVKRIKYYHLQVPVQSFDLLFHIDHLLSLLLGFNTVAVLLKVNSLDDFGLVFEMIKTRKNFSNGWLNLLVVCLEEVSMLLEHRSTFLDKVILSEQQTS